MAQNDNQKAKAAEAEPKAAESKQESKQSSGSGSVYKMSSHVDGPVKESGSEEARYIPAYEPFYVDEAEAFRLKSEGRAEFAKPQESDEVSAASRDDAEKAFENHKAKEAEEMAKEFAYLSSNELQPKSASLGMKAHTAAESNAMPAGSEDMAVADHSVFVVNDPMYDGVRGKFVDEEKVKADLDSEDKAK